MKGFILSLKSEFYKSRKTLGFWAAILLPFLLLFFISIGYYTNSDKVAGTPGLLTWMRFASIPLNVMGALLLPMYVIFIAYSVNSIEHKADTWKTLFSLPIGKWWVYAAKFFYALLLVFITLMLFALFTIGFGNLLGLLKPEIKFADYHMELVLLQVYFKLFLSALGILSIQFLLSLLWSDFLKPMGIGFLLFIAGVVCNGVGWKYAYTIPYAHPMLALKSMFPRKPNMPPTQIVVDIFTQDVFISLGVSVVVFIAGFYIVQKKSVK
jgi:lantibiotic transport system permease protein